MDYSVLPPSKIPFGFMLARQIFIVLIRSGVLVLGEGEILFSARLFGKRDGYALFGPRLSPARLKLAWEAMVEKL